MVSTIDSPGFLSMGQDTFQVSFEKVFQANRKKLCSKLQEEAAGAEGGVIFLMGGTNPERFDSDHEPLFRQESYFWYLTGVKEPDCAMALDVATGKCTLFVPKLPADYATIMGPIKTCGEIQQLYQVDACKYVDDIETTLEELLLTTTAVSTKKRRKAGDDDEKKDDNGPTTPAGTDKKLLLMKGLNTDSGRMYEPPTSLLEKAKNCGVLQSHADADVLFPILCECRVIKTDAELDLLRHVTELSSHAHAYVMRNLKPGMMEYQGESLFRHYCYFAYGCRFVGYTPICGCGPNSAILHYGHSGEPNARPLGDGDICLFDLGAEYCGYGSDITCSFPANGNFTEKQKEIYNGVLQAQLAVYEMLKPGVSWVDCHKAAEKAILKQLAKIGIVIPGDKSLDELVEMRLGAVFLPCGLGHFIGIDTHDVGGYLPGHPERIDLPGLRKLRTARIIQENMLITVEPGIYFIDHLLDGALAEDSPLKSYLNQALIDEEYRGFGGVRLEDILAITKDGCINYTLCPRTIEEVEHVMSGGKWPPAEDARPELLRKRLTDPNTLPMAPAPPSL